VTLSNASRPAASSPEALVRMVKQRRRDTKPEIAIRQLLFAQGFRYRVDAALPEMRRRADLLFRTARVAVFIDGCFWHGCPEHGTRPKSNAGWWAEKIDRNVQRDRDTDQRLVAGGWTVIRVWEHESPEAAACKVADAVRAKG
jgi:DNA mismatch endonuclease (patch repair protein)